MRREGYFQLEDKHVVTAVFETDAGSMWVRCLGAAFRITLKSAKGRVLSTAVLALPHGRKAAAVLPRSRRRRRRTSGRTTKRR